MTELLQRIDRYLNRVPLIHCDALDLPPFTLFLSRRAAQGYPSYARPTAPLPVALDPILNQVHARFAERELEPRWEFIAELAPDLLPRLEAAGFTGIRPTPLMAVTPDSFRPEAHPEIETRWIGPGGDLAPLLLVQRTGFSGEELVMVTAEDVAAAQMLVQSGTRFWGAYLEGEAVSAGVHTPIDGVTEAAGVATLPAYRRRGAGGALTSALVSDAFAQGCELVFLTAGDARARRLYERVGFRMVGSGLTSMD